MCCVQHRTVAAIRARTAKALRNKLKMVKIHAHCEQTNTVTKLIKNTSIKTDTTEQTRPKRPAPTKTPRVHQKMLTTNRQNCSQQDLESTSTPYGTATAPVQATHNTYWRCNRIHGTMEMYEHHGDILHIHQQTRTPRT